jgi:hypothetical protein
MRGFSEALALAKELNSTDPSNRELYLDGRFSLAQDESLQVSINTDCKLATGSA